MALIASIDGTVSPRLIYLSSATVGASIHPIDLYKEMRTLRRTNTSLRQYDVFMSAFGNVPKGGGKFTERYVRLNDCRIVPYDTSHVLTITGTLITDDGFEGIFAFDKSPLSSTSAVDIAYTPPQVEIVTISTGSGVTAQDKLDIASATWNDVRAQTLLTNVEFIKDIEGGKWEIVNNEMIFYKSDNITEVARFTLAPNASSPTSRVRV